MTLLRRLNLKLDPDTHWQLLCLARERHSTLQALVTGWIKREVYPTKPSAWKADHVGVSVHDPNTASGTSRRHARH